jgi:4-amino-4-deoxy-L-arabinose transferase-like glycosyltransferase
LTRLSIALCVFALLVTYWCTATAYDPLTGMIAVTLLGISTAFWRASGLLLTEMPFMAFFTGAVVCFYLGLHRSERWFHASWLCWAAAFLTRYTAVLFACIAVAFTLAALLQRAPGARERIRSRAFFIAPCLGIAAVAPWLARQYAVFGDPFVGAREAATQLQRFMPDMAMPWHFYATAMPELLSVPVFLAVLLGTIWASVRRDGFALHCLAACLIVLTWMSFYRFKEPRMAMSVLPLLAIVGAAGLARTPRGTPSPLRVVAVPLVALAAAFILQLYTMRQSISSTVTLGYPSFLDAMQFLRAQSPPAAVVIGANHPQIHWYADRTAMDLPERPNLKDALDRSAWIVLTNFERGQKEYAGDLVRYVTRADIEARDAAIFQDVQFTTVLLRSSLLRERLP